MRPHAFPPPPTRLRPPAVLTALALALALAAPAAAAPLDEPDALGPWDVGRTTLSFTDASRGRTLPVDVWYPVDPADAGGPPSVYDLLFTGLVSAVATDAPPPSSAGAFPLVVFSHGNDGIRFQSFFLAEHLASHGMIVAAPDHVGNTALDLLIPGTPFETRDRPLDVSFVITRMLEKSADPADPFAGRVDPERVGVAGHSFGGFTTLAMGIGFQDVPPDPRVKVLVPISPASSGFSDAQLASLVTPLLVVGGTADTTTPIDPQSTRPFDLASSRPRYRVDVAEAGHNSFTDICSIGDALLGAGLPPLLLEFLLGNLEDGCAPELIAPEEAHRLTDLYVTAFLKRLLVGDPRYARFLAPGRVVRDGLAVDFFAVPGGGPPATPVVGRRGAGAPARP